MDKTALSWTDPRMQFRIVAAVLLLLTLVFLWLGRTYGKTFITEWWLWLILLQSINCAALVYRLKKAGAVPAWREFLLVNGVIIGLAVLALTHWLDYAFWRTLDVLFRLALGGAWGFLIYGLFRLPGWVREEVRRQRAGTAPTRRFSPAKLWLLTAAALVAAEPALAFREWHQRRIHFPANLSAAPEGEIHIAAIGDSTMAGEPYFEKFNIPAAVGWQLQSQYPNRKIVVQNLAERGQNLRGVLARLDRLECRPHLLLVYAGHNEFYHDLEEMQERRRATTWSPLLDSLLAHTRLFRLGRRWFDRRSELHSEITQTGILHPHIALPELYERRRREFARQLRELAAFCHRERIATLWFVPAGNEADFAPNLSWHDRDESLVDAALAERFLSIYDDGLAAAKAGKLAEAERIFEQGLAESPRFAEFHFQLGRIQVALGKFDAARQSFQSALEDDGWPIRIPAEFRQAIVDVAAETGIPVIRAADVLRPHTRHGILDQTMFHDNVHPTLKAYDLLSREVVRQIHQQRLLGDAGDSPATTEPLSYDDVATKGGLTRADIVKAYRHNAEVHRWLDRLRWETSEAERQAARFEDLAKRLEAGTLQPGEEDTDYLPPSAATE